jgi:hypothetical protein
MNSQVTRCELKFLIGVFRSRLKEGEKMTLDSTMLDSLIELATWEALEFAYTFSDTIARENAFRIRYRSVIEELAPDTYTVNGQPILNFTTGKGNQK